MGCPCRAFGGVYPWHWEDSAKDLSKKSEVSLEHHLEDLHYCVAIEGRHPGEHYVEHDANAPDVHLATVLLGHHIRHHIVGRPQAQLNPYMEPLLVLIHSLHLDGV